jgi:hypothetical protein
VLRRKIAEFVQNSDFGLASGQRSDGTYDRVWFGELLAPDEFASESDVFVLTQAKAGAVKAGLIPPPVTPPQSATGSTTGAAGAEPTSARPAEPGQPIHGYTKRKRSACMEQYQRRFGIG